MTQHKLLKTNFHTDPNYLIKEILNVIYDEGKFLYALDLTLRHIGYIIDEVGIIFPDFDVADASLHFSGVKLRICETREVISESEYLEHIKNACKEYLELHPADRDIVTSKFQRSDFSGSDWKP